MVRIRVTLAPRDKVTVRVTVRVRVQVRVRAGGDLVGGGNGVRVSFLRWPPTVLQPGHWPSN